jgi:hypothetical protein
VRNFVSLLIHSHAHLPLTSPPATNSRFTTRPVFDSLPLSGDFPKAQRLLHNFFTRVGRKHSSIRSISYEDAIIPIQSIWDTRTLNALPKTYEEALVAREHDIGMTHQPNATRSIEWLAENGKCVDHISPGQSTIEGAGHGAFTKRDLPKGTIITGSPLHHLPMKESFMPMHRTFYYDENAGAESKADIIGYQLLMNYCFGHSETSLLLCPCKYVWVVSTPTQHAALLFMLVLTLCLLSFRFDDTKMVLELVISTTTRLKPT